METILLFNTYNVNIHFLMVLLKSSYLNFLEIYIYIYIRYAPIDRPVIGFGRSVSRLADTEPILLLPAAQAETSQPRTHSQSHVNTLFHVRMILILMAFSVNGD